MSTRASLFVMGFAIFLVVLGLSLSITLVLAIIGVPMVFIGLVLFPIGLFSFLLESWNSVKGLFSPKKESGQHKDEKVVEMKKSGGIYRKE